MLSRDCESKNLTSTGAAKGGTIAWGPQAYSFGACNAGARSPCTGGVPKLSKREPGVSGCAESAESRRRKACRGVGEPRSAAAAFTVAAWLRVTTIGEHIWLSRCSMSSGSCVPVRHMPVHLSAKELKACAKERLVRQLVLKTLTCACQLLTLLVVHNKHKTAASPSYCPECLLCTRTPWLLGHTQALPQGSHINCKQGETGCVACSAREVRRILWEP